MAKISLTVKQIFNLGLWEQVCDYKGWEYYIYNEGRIGADELVEFDDELKQEEEYKIKVVKSEPNEIGAVVVLYIDYNSFELEHVYDNEDIEYDEIISKQEVMDKINELRQQGLVGIVK